MRGRMIRPKQSARTALAIWVPRDAGDRRLSVDHRLPKPEPRVNEEFGEERCSNCFPGEKVIVRLTWISDEGGGPRQRCERSGRCALLLPAAGPRSGHDHHRREWRGAIALQQCLRHVNGAGHHWKSAGIP